MRIVALINLCFLLVYTVLYSTCPEEVVSNCKKTLNVHSKLLIIYC